MKKLIIVTAMFAVTACAPVKFANPNIDESVKEFTPVAGKAQVYICRDGRLFGIAVNFKVELDDQLSNIAANTFTYREVEPGTHVAIAKTHIHDSIYRFEIAAGEQKFFQVWPSFGGAVLIDEIDREAGKRCVRSGNLLQSEPG